MIAAVFGILALLTQAGFTLGASAALTAAPPGSLTADLAKLCLGSIDDADGGRKDSQPENLPDCDHCTLCGIAAVAALPTGNQNTFGRIAAAAPRTAGAYQAQRQSFTRFRNPRAPPA
mgnify:CR=1 FL=1